MKINLYRILTGLLCLIAAPVNAQRATTRVQFEKGSIPIAVPLGMHALLPAPGLTLSAPSLAPTLAVPAPALMSTALAAAAAPVAVRPALAAAALAGSVPSAASAQAHDSERAPKAAPLADLQKAAREEDGAPDAGRIFDGSRPEPVVSDPAGLSRERRRGTVRRWNEVRGYGFIAPKDGGEAVYVTAENIDQPTAALKVLKEGEEVEFALEQTPNGPIAVKVIPVRLLPKTVAGAGTRRPLVESWLVEGKEYASTRDLVRALPNGAAPVEATYRFAHSDKPLPPARAANTAVGFAAGGALGALLGTAFFVMGSIAAPIMDVFLGGGGAGPALSELGLFAGFFGGAGAAVGTMIGWIESRAPQIARESISGQIYRHAGPSGETVYFAAERNGGKILVDLGAYASAQPSPEPSAPAPWPLWKRAAAGLAVGAALAVSQWVPLLQILALPLAGPAVGAGIGRALTAGTGIAGGWLGGSLGLLVPFAAFLSFAAVPSAGLLMPFGVFVGALAALGLVVGVFAADAVRAEDAREAARNPAGQWWGAAKGK